MLIYFWLTVCCLCVCVWGVDYSNTHIWPGHAQTHWELLWQRCERRFLFLLSFSNHVRCSFCTRTRTPGMWMILNELKAWSLGPKVAPRTSFWPPLLSRGRWVSKRLTASVAAGRPPVCVRARVWVRAAAFSRCFGFHLFSAPGSVVLYLEVEVDRLVSAAVRTSKSVDSSRRTRLHQHGDSCRGPFGAPGNSDN